MTVFIVGRTVKRLPLPTTVSPVDHPNLFAHFLLDKVHTTGDKLDNIISMESLTPYSYDTIYQQQPLGTSESVSMHLVRTVVLKSPPVR